MEKEIEASLKFWNEAYKDIKGQKFEKKDLYVIDEMKPIFDRFTFETKIVIDFGCGEGEMLMYLLNSGTIDKAYGIENGENIVKAAKSMMDLNGFSSKSEILDGGIKALDQFKDGSIDGIVLSNVLDVVTPDVADNIASSLTRVLKKNGLLLFKVNPEFTKEGFEKMGFNNFKDNMYSKNGVFRARNLSKAEWMEYFSKDYVLLSYALIPYQAPNFLDRLFLFKKK